MQTVDRIVEVLEEAGIDHVFGIPGGDTGRIFKALYHKQDKIKVVVARDEQTAACMAEMYGRLTGRPGVAGGAGMLCVPRPASLAPLKRRWAARPW